ncbi:hypothetical protein PF006_g70 [Phytophthora fragariae]|uniref:C2 domain-containing protein n=1 Tax=Phytophthora fragariae TaxID=53985 RepID=A0A6A3MG45_9STRA|nr:hypothetical protein PF011_g61 [Phytophthora fragariae]KAE9155996.1 hypothetical protein PF006_g70 [Phytophthora fragariae]
MRSEKSININPDKPVLKVEILTGHGLSPADLNGYSDPYCTLSITDRTTGKDIETEKKRTAVISKTLNPVWAHENFIFGNNVPLSEARSLLIHIKDHNNIGRSTPLGRVEIPLYDLCRASADVTSISSKEVVKRYELQPEPWMKKHAKHLGELCIKTEMVGNATVLAELMQRVSNISMEKSLSILSFSEANIQSEVSMDMGMSAAEFDGTELEDETTETIQRGAPIRTSTSRVLSKNTDKNTDKNIGKNTATWRKEKFSFSLSYPGIFSDAKYPSIETQLLQLRIHEARNLVFSDAAGNPTSRDSLKPDAELSSESHHKKLRRAQDAANIFFTVIPVRGDGTLEDAERVQSLTVYDSRDPSWPKEKFVFGKIKDISNVSYLSLHLYGRDVQNDEQVVLSKLLPDEEKTLDEIPKKTLKRYQVHKLSPAGVIDDDDFEILQYDQRVLAFRGGEDGGRFYPARVQKYIPFPRDEYEVHFEDKIDTINELRNLYSFDVEGVVQAVRNDGRVDVVIENELSGSELGGNVNLKDSSRYTVMPTQLTPLEKGLTDEVKMVMARRFDIKEEEKKRWTKLQHTFSGIAIDISSVSNLLMPVYDDNGNLVKLKPLDESSEPTCRLTLLGNPGQLEHNLCYLSDHGELFAAKAIAVSSKRTWEEKSPLEATVESQTERTTEPTDDETSTKDEETATTKREAGNDEALSEGHVASECQEPKHEENNTSQVNDLILFEKNPLVLGVCSSKPGGCKECNADDTDSDQIDTIQADMGSRVLKMASSILIRVNAKMEVTSQDATNKAKSKSPKSNKGVKPEPEEKTFVEHTIGYAKVDLASLELGQKELRLEIVPVFDASGKSQQNAATHNVPYHTSLGSLFVDITTQIDTALPQQTLPTVTNAEEKEPRLWDRELSSWYKHQLKTEPSSIYTRGATWIERRQLLRSSLTPLGNAQIDALHTILVVIMKRIVDILREIRLFEQFEMLSTDEMRKCRLIHTVNADPNSGYIGRTFEKLSTAARREIVVGLENELLDLSGVEHECNDPKLDISREEWVQIRTKRQQLLRDKGDFFMSDQTSTSIVSVPRSFTGKGIVAWILRKPSVLWSDEWKKYSKDPACASVRLGWGAQDKVRGVGALHEPIEEVDAVQWMSALCAAGFVENVTPGIVALADLGKRQVLMENKADRFYRLREVDMLIEKLPREKSLFPLDLVQEIDCYCPPMPNPLKKETGKDSNDTVKLSEIYRKKLTEHCDGFLGMHSMISDLLFSVKGWTSRKPSVSEKPDERAAAKTEDTSKVVEKIMWNWKYCLFIPSRKQLYMYEKETSTYPMAFIDMASAACKVAYNVTPDAKGGRLDITNPTVYKRKPDSQDYVPATAEALDEMARLREKGEKVIELKTLNTQKWIHALAQAGVCVDMIPGQRVLMKRLNPVVLQQKCNKHATRFKPNDLEGSFHRLLNRLFGHDKEMSHQDHERERRDQRAQLRSELKKAGAEGEVVMAYYGKGKQLKSKPKYSGNFRNGSLYSARILRIRTPFTEEDYMLKTKYDMKNKEEVPDDLVKLLAKYNVTDRTSWKNLPKSQRDMFLLYDVEYSHANERIVEVGLMREHIRTNEGDLDPDKVRDKCTDLNIMFKAIDLENCVSRMLKHRYHHKPLGVLNIPVTMISPHRTIDAWYPLGPANDMLQKTRLGQIRVELKRVQKREIKRSAKIIEAVESEISSQSVQEGNSSKTQKKPIPFAVGREPSFVKVSILEGRSLRVADFLTSDPFVEIVLLGNDDSKEHDTGLKTDIKMRTLNPKWENQEFLLGKTEKTKLSDKTGVLLRVMDYDATSANDPLGCATIEFQRSETGYIRGITLRHADTSGNNVMEELKLDEDNRAVIEAMLLPYAGQRSSKKKMPGPDGLLGKLRVLVEIVRNENYADPNIKLLETSYSAEIAIKKADPLGQLGEYSCYFQPHGEGGLRIQYVPASEDLGLGNPYKLKDLLQPAAPTARAEAENVQLPREAYKILGRTYDLAKVDYITVRLVSDSTGRVFEGQLGKLDRKSGRKTDGKAEKKLKFSLKNPLQYASFRDETIVLIDQEDSKQKVTLTFDLNLIGILRADRVRRILADTFRMAGLTFDSRTFNSGRYNPNVAKDAHTFLWDMCRANVSSGDNVSEEVLAQELLTQVRVMSQASKLHWKITPQLLAYVFEIVFSGGERDRLSYADAVALDDVLNRWSRILSHVNEAKDYMTGNLHGMKTPRLLEALFMECEWTGFDFSSLKEADSSPKSGVSNILNSGHSVDEKMSPIRVEDRVTARLSFLKHAGLLVDVRLRNNDVVAAMIVKEYGGDRYGIKLVGANSKDAVFVCAHGNDEHHEPSQEIKRGRLARFKQKSETQNPENPYLLEYLDNQDPHEEELASEPMDAATALVEGAILMRQLQREDYVEVSQGVMESKADTNNQSRLAKVLYNHGNARYDIMYIDGRRPMEEKSVTRRRLTNSISDALAAAYEDASTICKRLQNVTTLTLDGDTESSESVVVDKASWTLATSGKPTMSLPVAFTNSNRRRDLVPKVSLAPREDIRVQVCDSDNRVHELHFRMRDVLEEANVRRTVTPFIKAKVDSDTEALNNGLTSRCSVKFKKTGKKEYEDAVDVPMADLKFDMLSIEVLEASNMVLKENAGTDGLIVEVYLVSSDFRKHMATEKNVFTPFGVKVSSSGVILPEEGKKIYPQETAFLLTLATKANLKLERMPAVWRANKQKSLNTIKQEDHPSVDFKYPVVDLDRVSEVKLIIRDKKTQAKVGAVTIPMNTIGDKIKRQDEPILRLNQEGSEQKRVVGTISLTIARIKKIAKKSQEVYGRQLKSSMDFWSICPKELLKTTLQDRENKLACSFLAAGPPVSGGGKIVLKQPLEMETQLQKISQARCILRTLDLMYSTLPSNSVTATVPTRATTSSSDLASRAVDQLRHSVQQTKLFVKETAHDLGLGDYTTERRLPWSLDAIVDESKQTRHDVVVVEANVGTCTLRVRENVQKLHEVFMRRYIPRLDELYVLDSQGDQANIAKGERLLSFFDNEVDELEYDDQQIRHRLYQRIRLAKLAQVLDMIMRASLRVKVMDEDRNNVDVYLGTACIPLIDLLDQHPRDDVYQLLFLPTTNLRGTAYATQSLVGVGRGKVRLHLHLKLSESSFFEQANNVYKVWKAKYIAQHEAARRRIHDAVVPAQLRRWMIMKGYLDELTMQSKGKLHWERTPVLLSLVWDIFFLQESSPAHSKEKSVGVDELEYTQKVTQMADEYRDVVMKVHDRWVNLQPELDELLNIQAAELIHAQRTPEVLDDIEREIEGLDVGLSTAWHQVKQKWLVLLNALEELASMQERKLNLTRAPVLLKIVENRCSKGLNIRHSEAVSNIQSRWMAITQLNGPLSELRLMEKKGLHWRRTHELLLLLDEQCEGFADVDARALDTVQNRWEQVQEWLDEVVQMQQQHTIDCEHTPFILEKMHLWIPVRMRRQDEVNKAEKRSNSAGLIPPSPKNRDDTSGRSRGLYQQSSSSRLSSEGSFRTEGGVDDNGQLEGMIEWYAIEEAKLELERIPYHRIATEAEKKNWLPYSRDGKDTRLLIAQEEMVFTPANVRFALEERGVIPTTSNFDPTNTDTAANIKAKSEAWVSPTLADPKSGSQSVALPIAVKNEITELEQLLEKHRDGDQQAFSLPNPERVAELYEAIESLGKMDLLWNVDHVVSKNRELAVPESYKLLLREMTIRQIPTTEVENLVKSLAFTMQKEVLIEKGITVPMTANPTTLLQIMDRYQIKEVTLPKDTGSIQTYLQERGMDRKGDPVMLRGIRIGTQATGAASILTSSGAASSTKAINTGLGIIDTQIELLRKTLLIEALRKRNSLVRTFPGKSRVLDDENERTNADVFAAAVEYAEVDMSGDYLTLVERFQRQLVHESYTRRLAEYAALDRCVRALLGKNRDEVITKEEIAMELHNVNKKVVGANYRLPPEAFTEDELKRAASAGRIRTPSDEILARCPKGNNASAMAHYTAISYAANVFQEMTSFRSRVVPTKNSLADTFPFDDCSSLDGVVIPKQRRQSSITQSIADWLLGFDTSALSIKRKLSAAHRQRLVWSSAAFTLRNRWLQCGLGWCDRIFGEGVGVKVLLDRLLLFEAANKMHMVKTEMLLREVRDKCSRLREREREAQAKLEERYQFNLELLEQLVTHAERCMNNRKLHSEDTPVLLHKIEQNCVVPSGLNERHREAYHTVATHWLPQQQHLSELMKMHREGTFSISRTPELLGKMKYHTEGKAGSEELNEEKVAASAQRVAPELQATFVDRKLNEVRLGQRKEPSSLNLDLSEDEDVTNQSVEDSAWKELSHSKRVAQPLSPHEKQTSWKLVKNAVAANAAFSASSPRKGKADDLKVEIGAKVATQSASPRRKFSLSEELKELLRSPTQWLTGSGFQDETIAAELYFPKEVVLETSGASLTGPTL